MNPSDWPRCPLVPVAWGELFDKLSILAIKAERIADSTKRRNILAEYQALQQIAGDLARFPAPLMACYDRLKTVNAQLWDIEDGKRSCEARQCFDARFIELARSVYRLNDERAAIKREINCLLDSALFEEKSHPVY
ncbi:DUF6165 family protein [Desulfuromonas thiophila]|uniref:Uncharacterized protein n=1 Tax=Desulfuromonas thiophila TaxID=57664 RepID=A0A1G7BWU0_9BACT|nr:DUF6165 family protein [Desulfuromonas thiophila]SDE30846.1 hypothetical protein SAMN05661003_10757 [Desulfuromonas thiophila]